MRDALDVAPVRIHPDERAQTETNERTRVRKVGRGIPVGMDTWLCV